MKNATLKVITVLGVLVGGTVFLAGLERAMQSGHRAISVVVLSVGLIMGFISFYFLGVLFSIKWRRVIPRALGKPTAMEWAQLALLLVATGAAFVPFQEIGFPLEVFIVSNAGDGGLAIHGGTFGPARLNIAGHDPQVRPIMVAESQDAPDLSLLPYIALGITCTAGAVLVLQLIQIIRRKHGSAALGPDEAGRVSAPKLEMERRGRRILLVGTVVASFALVVIVTGYLFVDKAAVWLAKEGHEKALAALYEHLPRRTMLRVAKECLDEGRDADAIANALRQLSPYGNVGHLQPEMERLLGAADHELRNLALAKVTHDDHDIPEFKDELLAIVRQTDDPVNRFVTAEFLLLEADLDLEELETIEAALQDLRETAYQIVLDPILDYVARKQQELLKEDGPPPTNGTENRES